jgi:mRNA interferase MazF
VRPADARPIRPVCHQPESFDWRRRGCAQYQIKRVPDARFAQVLVILNQFVQLA